MLIGIRTKHGRKPLHLQTPQQQIGVGHREGSAAAIASRAWIRTCGTGANGEPFPITVDDRSTPSGNGVNGQTGCQQMQARDHRFSAPLQSRIGMPCRQTEHIRAGATHVESDQRLLHKASPAGHRHRTDHAPSRARENRVFGQKLVAALQRTAGGHHPHPGGLPQGTAHLIEITKKRLGHGRFHQRGLSARNHARQRANTMGANHCCEADGTREGLQALLMIGMAPSVQKHDCAAT